jgi:hypothetical protein
VGTAARRGLGSMLAVEEERRERALGGLDMEGWMSWEDTLLSAIEWVYVRVMVVALRYGRAVIAMERR